jgi:hypothetical protein
MAKGRNNRVLSHGTGENLKARKTKTLNQGVKSQTSLPKTGNKSKRNDTLSEVQPMRM